MKLQSPSPRVQDVPDPRPIGWVVIECPDGRGMLTMVGPRVKLAEELVRLREPASQKVHTGSGGESVFCVGGFAQVQHAKAFAELLGAKTGRSRLLAFRNARRKSTRVQLLAPVALSVIQTYRLETRRRSN